jgi:2-oxoglutarate dehydrogenase E2 component (dihydrolipoamide succinyltransferase)
MFSTKLRPLSKNKLVCSSPLIRNITTVLRGQKALLQHKPCGVINLKRDIVVDIKEFGAESIVEGTVQKWNKAVGDFVRAEEVVGVLETEKVTVDVKAPVSGYITAITKQPGEDVRKGDAVFEMDPADAPANAPKASTPAKEAPKTSATPAKEAPKTSGTPAKETPKAATPAKADAPKAEIKLDAPKVAGSRGEKRERMSKMRQKIAERLKESQNIAAMLTTFNEVDMHNLIEMRNKYKDAFEKKHGTKFGYLPAFIKASSSALRDFPAVNACFEGNEIVFRDYHDISVAVATPNGLVVPVIRNAESLSMAELEKTLALMGQKARDGKMAIEDFVGGTFTISNGGVFGSMMGTPIINPPQSAILGMHAINKRAVVINDEIKIRPMMYLALTYDHRMIDGREAVLFLKKIKSVIESPEILLLDL